MPRFKSLASYPRREIRGPSPSLSTSCSRRRSGLRGHKWATCALRPRKAFSSTLSGSVTSTRESCLSELAVSSAEGGPEASAAGKVEAQLAADGKVTVSDCNGSWEVTREMVKWTVSEKTVQEVKFRPSVIEPSFG